jgi:hypothetical protein
MGCAFCVELARIAVNRRTMSNQAYAAAVDAIFDQADRVHLVHKAYRQKRRRRRFA